jgi:glycosidase
VRERQAAYLVEMMSMGVSGFRFDAAKHMRLNTNTKYPLTNC